MSYQYRPRRMDKIKRLTTRNVIESVLMRWMNLESIIQSEVSQKKKKITYIYAYIWNLERWYWWIYLQGSNGEGNGTPLPYSCLENPMDGGAWWAAVYGVAQSRTWLKRLSSNGDADIENGFVNTVGEGEGGMNRESGIESIPYCMLNS